MLIQGKKQILLRIKLLISKVIFSDTIALKPMEGKIISNFAHRDDIFSVVRGIRVSIWAI